MANIHDTTSKILIVDDEKLIRLTISAKLKGVGYVPVAVGSVDEAVKVLKEGHGAFRAVITDIMMGDIQGHGTSAALAMTAVQSFLKRF